MFFNFHCRYLMLTFLYYSSSICFASWGKMMTPGAILPSVKHFQTTAERHYSAYFSSAHINQANNFTSYNYFMRQNIRSCFALWGKIYSPGAILHQPNMIGWTGHMTSLDSLTVSVDWDICKWISRQVMLCFQCWQVVSSFFLALREL